MFKILSLPNLQRMYRKVAELVSAKCYMALQLQEVNLRVYQIKRRRLGRKTSGITMRHPGVLSSNESI